MHVRRMDCIPLDPLPDKPDAIRRLWRAPAVPVLGIVAVYASLQDTKPASLELIIYDPEVTESLTVTLDQPADQPDDPRIGIFAVRFGPYLDRARRVDSAAVEG